MFKHKEANVTCIMCWCYLNYGVVLSCDLFCVYVLVSYLRHYRVLFPVSGTFAFQDRGGDVFITLLAFTYFFLKEVAFTDKYICI